MLDSIENHQEFKPGDKFRDGTCTYILHYNKPGYLLTLDNEEVKAQYTADGLLFYEKDGQRFYALYA